MAEIPDGVSAISVSANSPVRAGRRPDNRFKRLCLFLRLHESSDAKPSFYSTEILKKLVTRGCISPRRPMRPKMFVLWDAALLCDRGGQLLKILFETLVESIFDTLFHGLSCRPSACRKDPGSPPRFANRPNGPARAILSHQLWHFWNI